MYTEDVVMKYLQEIGELKKEIEKLREENEQLKAQLAAVERDFNDYSKSVNGLL